MFSKKDQTNSSKCENLEKFTFFFRLKGLLYLLKQDKKSILLKYFIQRPIFHSLNLIKSYIQKKPYVKEEKDLFLFNLKNLKDLNNWITNKKTILAIGFSYCMKPKKCPQKRFSPYCIYDSNHFACSTCFIKKCINLISKEDIFLIIPDVYYICNQLLDIKKKHPKKELVFIIITCSFSIHMFADNANMVKIKGIGIRLSSKVCINNKSFLLAEKGIKPVETSLSVKTQNKVLDILKIRSKLFIKSHLTKNK